jgi:hypothetical protein
MLRRVEEAGRGIAAYPLPARDDGVGVDPSVDPGVEAETGQPTFPGALKRRGIIGNQGHIQRFKTKCLRTTRLAEQDMPSARLSSALRAIKGECDQTAIQSADLRGTNCATECGGDSDTRRNHYDGALFWP